MQLNIYGLAADAVLKEDKSQVALLDASGSSLYRGEGDDLEVRHEDGTSGPDQFDQTVKIPARLVQEHGSTSVQIKATYSMTLFTLRSFYTMKAVNDDQMLAGWGRCRTRVDGAYAAVEMICLQMGKA